MFYPRSTAPPSKSSIVTPRTSTSQPSITQASTSDFSQSQSQRLRKSQAEEGEEPVARKRQRLQIEHEKMLTIEATMLEKEKDARGPGGFSYRCLRCNRVIYMRIKAVAHAAQCTKKSTAKKRRGRKMLPCNVCGEAVARGKAMKQHRRLRHLHLLHQKKCTCCLRKFSSLKNYKRHIVRRKNKVSFQCGNCVKSFSTPTNLKRHVYAQHQKESPSSAGAPITHSTPPSSSFASFQPSSIGGVTFLPSSAGAPITHSTPPSSSSSQGSIRRDLTAADDQVAFTLS